MGPPMWPWRCGLMARPVSGVEWSGATRRVMPTDEWPIKWPLICGHDTVHSTVNF